MYFNSLKRFAFGCMFDNLYQSVVGYDFLNAFWSSFWSCDCHAFVWKTHAEKRGRFNVACSCWAWPHRERWARGSTPVSHASLEWPPLWPPWFSGWRGGGLCCGRNGTTSSSTPIASSKWNGETLTMKTRHTTWKHQQWSQYIALSQLWVITHLPSSAFPLVGVDAHLPPPSTVSFPPWPACWK